MIHSEFDFTLVSLSLALCKIASTFIHTIVLVVIHFLMCFFLPFPSVQAHPEFEYNYAIQQRIWKSVVEKNKKLSDVEIEIATESFATYTDHDALLLLHNVARWGK